MAQTQTQDLIQAAAHQAAGGNYEAATALLDQIGPEPQPLEALLLRARIAAQRKQYDQAIAFWEQALRQDPDCPQAREGIALARGLRSNPAGGFFLRAGLYYAGLLLLVVVLSAIVIMMSLGSLGRGRPDDLSKQIGDMQADLKTLSAEAREVEQKLSDTQVQMAGFQQIILKTVQTADEHNGRMAGMLEEIRRLQQEQTARRESTEAMILRTRQDVSDLLGLSEDLGVLTEQWGRIEKKWFGPDPAERRKMQDDLGRLNETMELLLGKMRQMP